MASTTSFDQGLSRVMNAMQRQDSDLACTLAQDVVDQYPKSLSANRVLGEIYEITGQDTDALRCYQAVILFDPLDAHIYVRTSDILKRAGKPQLASDYERIASDYGVLTNKANGAIDDPVSVSRRAVLNERAGLHAQAVDALGTLIASGSERLDLCLLLARSLVTLGLMKEAQPVIGAVLDRAPDCIEGNVIAAFVSFELKRRDEARAYLGKAYEGDPSGQIITHFPTAARLPANLLPTHFLHVDTESHVFHDSHADHAAGYSGRAQLKEATEFAHERPPAVLDFPSHQPHIEQGSSGTKREDGVDTDSVSDVAHSEPAVADQPVSLSEVASAPETDETVQVVHEVETSKEGPASGTPPAESPGFDQASASREGTQEIPVGAQGEQDMPAVEPLLPDSSSEAEALELARPDPFRDQFEDWFQEHVLKPIETENAANEKGIEVAVAPLSIAEPRDDKLSEPDGATESSPSELPGGEPSLHVDSSSPVSRSATEADEHVFDGLLEEPTQAMVSEDLLPQPAEPSHEADTQQLDSELEEPQTVEAVTSEGLLIDPAEPSSNRPEQDFEREPEERLASEALTREDLPNEQVAPFREHMGQTFESGLEEFLTSRVAEPADISTEPAAPSTATGDQVFEGELQESLPSKGTATQDFSTDATEPSTAPINQAFESELEEPLTPETVGFQDISTEPAEPPAESGGQVFEGERQEPLTPETVGAEDIFTELAEPPPESGDQVFEGELQEPLTSETEAFEGLPTELDAPPTDPEDQISESQVEELLGTGTDVSDDDTTALSAISTDPSAEILEGPSMEPGREELRGIAPETMGINIISPNMTSRETPASQMPPPKVDSGKPRVESDQPRKGLRRWAIPTGEWRKPQERVKSRLADLAEIAEREPLNNGARFELAIALEEADPAQAVAQYALIIRSRDPRLVDNIRSRLENLLVAGLKVHGLQRLLGDTYMQQGSFERAIEAYSLAFDELRSRQITDRSTRR